MRSHTVLDWYQCLLTSNVCLQDDLALFSYGSGWCVCPNQQKIGVALLIALCFEPVGAALLIALFSEPVRMDFISVYALANMLRKDANIRTGIDVSKGTRSFIIAQRKTKMPAAQWTTKGQYNWLQKQLLEYIALHSKDKDYAHFWAKTHLYWFKRWPEQAALFPDIPVEITLTEEQQAAELAAEKTHKTNASKKNHSLKKEISIFETALLPKSCTKSVEEIYMDMVYDEQIKPLVKAEQEAGNAATAGCHMVLGQKISKELLEDESDEVKKEVKEKYNKQKKVKKDMLDDEANDNDETNADAIFPSLLQEHLDAWAPTIFLLILLVSALASHPYPDLTLVILVILAFPFALYLLLQQSQYIWPDPFADEAYPCSIPPPD
ncbi:uncharacterized protein EDB93DRAFT_1256791 [Suillus bovinus]|uniref:uncharacterized protein n=1 Tax=Suillus bovinus TaxID=48563 RepID=UPI001B868BE7|nr:uncharacterized protein EDB93DRAFT_1256791 [Suillus bovinus]KAG2128025.1 hypothetical protein EDB93DRAFT_1256791 [Suillus bovinus]